MSPVLTETLASAAARIELSSRTGAPGEYRCPVCDTLIEVLGGSKEVAYRLTVVPAKLSRSSPSAERKTRKIAKT